MGQNINVDVDYFDDPWTRRLVGLLGKGSEMLPLKLWAYTGKYHAEDGRLTDYSAQEIEACIGWWGERGLAVPALAKCRFLAMDGNTFVVADWLLKQGHLDALKERAKKAANARWGKLKGDATSNANSIAQASDKQCSNQPTNQPRKSSAEKERERMLAELQAKG